ncbi:hypothetical protein J6590_008825 [Homalodisca vitripennis]|nr:hypothetical protein J6590_008825 [Homalodisca vitripennis]
MLLDVGQGKKTTGLKIPGRADGDTLMNSIKKLILQKGLTCAASLPDIPISYRVVSIVCKYGTESLVTPLPNLTPCIKSALLNNLMHSLVRTEASQRNHNKINCTCHNLRGTCAIAVGRYKGVTLVTLSARHGTAPHVTARHARNVSTGTCAPAGHDILHAQYALIVMIRVLLSRRATLSPRYTALFITSNERSWNTATLSAPRRAAPRCAVVLSFICSSPITSQNPLHNNANNYFIFGRSQDHDRTPVIASIAQKGPRQSAAPGGQSRVRIRDKSTRGNNGRETECYTEQIDNKHLLR